MGASLKRPSCPDRTHALAACSHGTTLATNAPVNRTNLTCWCPQTKRACLFFTFPFGMVLALLGRESCQFLLGAPRPVVHSGSAPYGLLRVGTGSEWALLESPLLLYLLLKVDSEKNRIALQWRRIAICEESRTNTQSQVSLAPTNALEYKKRKLSQATGSASRVIHVTYALGGGGGGGGGGVSARYARRRSRVLQSRGARFARFCSLLAL